MDPERLLDLLRPRLDGALVALDFDGTLSPIVVDPADARPAPGAVGALTALAGKGARVAVITGRDSRTAMSLGGFDAVPGITVVGIYGAETWSDGELHTPPTPDSMTALHERLPQVVRAATPDNAVWIEDKRLSLVVHARRAAHPDAALAALRGPVESLAAELGLEVHPGRQVLEIRLPGFDKGAALRRLADGAGPVLFAGDDLGDLPAFAAIRELRADGRDAWGVVACSPDVPEVAEAADVRVDGPAGIVELLRELAG